MNKLMLFILFYVFNASSPLSAVKTEIAEIEDNSTIIQKNKLYVPTPNPSTKEEETIVSKNRESYKFFLLNILDNIPTETLFEIFYKLKPINIIQISKTSLNIKKRSSDLFWKNYLIIHKREMWDKSPSPIKVAFAYTYFDDGRLEEAAALGLPKAISLLGMNNNNNEKEEKLKTKAIKFFKKRILKNIENANNSINYSNTIPSFGFPITGACLISASTLQWHNK